MRLRGVIAQAAVADLAGGWNDGVGRDRIEGLLGGQPTDVPDRYRIADPIGLLPLGIPQVLLHGTRDDVVPLSRSRTYVNAAGSEAEFLEFEEADHFDLIEPKHVAWRAVVERFPALFSD